MNAKLLSTRRLLSRMCKVRKPLNELMIFLSGRLYDVLPQSS